MIVKLVEGFPNLSEEGTRERVYILLTLKLLEFQKPAAVCNVQLQLLVQCTLYNGQLLVLCTIYNGQLLVLCKSTYAITHITSLYPFK